jgi:heat shock protein 4
VTCLSLAAEWKTKTGLDLLNNPKALYRLSVAVDKVKQQLSGYTSTAKLPVNVECMQEDRDFASYIDTDTWTEMTRSLCERALEPVKAAISECLCPRHVASNCVARFYVYSESRTRTERMCLDSWLLVILLVYDDCGHFAALRCAGDSKLRFDQLDEIEVVGSATRSPLITNALRDFLGKEPKRTMNSEEAVAKGCALRAAMISPNFRVREFSIMDSCPYAIALRWSSSQQVRSQFRS